MKLKSRQSAAKHLTFDEILNNGESSTIIPRKGSTLYKYMMEKPNTVLNKLFSKNPIVNTNSCLYGIICINNYKLYIGSTRVLNKRYQKHRTLLRNNKHHSVSLQNAYNKYGKDSFYYFIFNNIDSNMLDENISNDEEQLIRKFDTVKHGFNDSYNTRRHLISSEQIAQNIKCSSIAVVELSIAGEYIRTHSSVSNAARSVNDQSTNISACCKGNIRYIKNRIWVYANEYNPNNIYNLKDVRKYNISTENAKKRACKGYNSKKVNIYDSEMNFIKIVMCKSDALRYINKSLNGVNYKYIDKALKNKTPYAAHYFMYSENMI